MNNCKNLPQYVMNSVIIVVLSLIVSTSCMFAGTNAQSVAFAAGESTNINMEDIGNPQGKSSIEDKTYEELYDELMEELNQDSALNTGDNARDAEPLCITPAEAYRIMDSHGFFGTTLKVENDKNGTIIGSKDWIFPGREVSRDDSVNAYPSYKATVFSPGGLMWTIMINEGKLFATAAPYANIRGREQIILSETDTITQYDCYANKYSDWKVGNLPSESVSAISMPVNPLTLLVMNALTTAFI